MTTPSDLIKAQEEERKKNDREKAIREFSYKNLDAAGMRKVQGDKTAKAYLDKMKKQGKMITPDALGMADQAGKKKEAQLLKLAKAKAEKAMPVKKYSKTLIQPSAGGVKYAPPKPKSNGKSMKPFIHEPNAKEARAIMNEYNDVVNYPKLKNKK